MRELKAIVDQQDQRGRKAILECRARRGQPVHKALRVRLGLRELLAQLGQRVTMGLMDYPAQLEQLALKELLGRLEPRAPRVQPGSRALLVQRVFKEQRAQQAHRE